MSGAFEVEACHGTMDNDQIIRDQVTEHYHDASTS